MKLVELSKMKTVKSYLSNNFPFSCKVFGLVQRVLMEAELGENGDTKFVYVDDDTENMNCVAVLHNADLEHKKKCNITCFVGSLNNEVSVDRICKLIEKLGYEDVVMGGLEAQLALRIGKNLAAPTTSSLSSSSSSSSTSTSTSSSSSSLLYNTSYSSCPYGLFVQESRVSMEMSLPPLGYELGELRLEDAAKINATWPYRSQGSEEMIRGMIENTTSTGAYYKGELVAW